MSIFLQILENCTKAYLKNQMANRLFPTFLLYWSNISRISKYISPAPARKKFAARGFWEEAFLDPFSVLWLVSTKLGAELPHRTAKRSNSFSNRKRLVVYYVDLPYRYCYFSVF